MECINGNAECGCLRGSVGMLDTGIKGAVGLASKQICGSVGMLDTGIKGKVGIICTPNTELYLRVEPKILWFFKKNETQVVNVESNTKWNVNIK